MQTFRSTLFGGAVSAVAGWAAMTGPAQAEGMASAELLASNCFNCHGPNGETLGIIPALSKMPAKRMIDYMNDYKKDSKVAPIMNRIAKGYSDKEIAAIAHYFEKINK